MHAAKGGVDGDILEFGDGFKGDVGFHAQSENFALFWGEACKRGANTKAEFAVAGFMGGGLPGAGQEGFEGGVGFAPAEGMLQADVGFFLAGEIDDPVAGNSEKPRKEFVGFVAVEALDGAEPDILKDIIRHMGIAHHAENKSVKGFPGLFDNPGKGLQIAVAVCVQIVFKGWGLRHKGLELFSWVFLYINEGKTGLLHIKLYFVPDGQVAA